MQKNYRPGGVGMIPALPGTYLLHLYFDSHQAELVRCNILGWQVGADRRLTPLVVDPHAADEDVWHVLHPDGRVEASNGKVWDSAEKWISDERRARREAA